MFTVASKAIIIGLLSFFYIQVGLAQFQLTIRTLDEHGLYGIFVKLTTDFSPAKLITGSGQVTLVVPTGSRVERPTNVQGNWSHFGIIQAPKENPNKDYVSVGFNPDGKRLVYKKDGETLLFTIKIDHPSVTKVTLINNESDPFAKLPNSQGTNPGNELSAIDVLDKKRIYSYSGNY